MRIEHYTVATPKIPRVRVWKWRIVGDDGAIVARGERMHAIKEESQREVEEILEFLEAWCRERMQYGRVV